MSGQQDSFPIDDLLLPFLQATGEQESQHHLEILLTGSAEPMLRSIVRQRLQPSPGAAADVEAAQGVEDVCSEILVQLLTRLRELKASPHQKSISNFRAYVAVVAYNACHEYIRRKYPRRYALRNRLRYLLTHDQAFALWESDGEHQCGFSEWANKKPGREGGRKLRQLREDSRTFEQSAMSGRDLGRMNLADVVGAVFQSIGDSVELDQLVSAIAEWMGIIEERLEPQSDRGETDRGPVDTRPGAAVEVEQRIYVRHLWSEICQLPPRQRAALLLNLKDGNGNDCIALFPLSGIATPRDIAALLEIPAEQFAELWNELPLDDATIARRLGITRQQVINLRKSARERLARRMKAFEEG